jgi:hypothetical protein
MPKKIGAAGQVINFNFINEFVAENLNKILYSTFTPGILNLEYNYVYDDTEIEITEFSALVLPKDKNFLVKADFHSPLKITIDSKPYLVAWMDWLEPSAGYVYDSWYYGASGYSSYSGYYDIPWISCTFDESTDKITSANHNLEIGDVVQFSTNLGGIITLTNYYVIAVETNTFQVSTTPAGTETDLIISGSNNYQKINSHILRFDMKSEEELDLSYQIILGEFKEDTIGSVVYRVFDTLYQSRVYLNNNCINYDKVEWLLSGEGTSGYSGYSGPRTLEGSDSDHMGISGWSGISGVYDETDETIERHLGHASGYIPLNDGVLNLGLNAQYLNGISAGNEDNNIAIANGNLCSNLIAARLFLNGVEYGIGQSGKSGYSGFSGYTGWSGFSGASGYRSYTNGYIPVSNSVLQTQLNAEYLEGYKLEELSPVDHTHYIEFIEDGTLYRVLTGVDENGLVTTDGIQDLALTYNHQSLSTPFRYDDISPKKMFMLAGQIGKGQSQIVSFRKTFADNPRVFLLNNETDEWKAVNEEKINTVGFEVNWTENTKSDPSGVSGYLVSDTTDFSTYWIAIGELE